MQQAIRVLMLMVLGLLMPNWVFAASTGKPIEVLSDPYGVGSPTKYSVLRGSTKITFSHPFSGQFTRAEISVRGTKSNTLTRFLLSSDGKTYRPVMQLEMPFEKHFSTNGSVTCPDAVIPGQPAYFSRAFAEKAVDAETIAKTREMLTRANFFDKSCSDSAFGEDHRNAVMNAMADVLAKSTQDTQPEPKYLRCLEKYGYAHEAGVIEAFVKQSTTQSSDPRIRLACTSDPKAKPAEFDDANKRILIKKTPKPDRETYAAKIFHEALHTAPIRDGAALQAMEECCTLGEQCEVLQAYAEQKKSGEKRITAAEAIDTRNAINTATVTALKGPDGEAAAFGLKNSTVTNFENISFGEEHKTPLCDSMDAQKCQSQIIKACETAQEILVCPAPKPQAKSAGYFQFGDLLLSTAKAASICDQGKKDGADVSPRIEAAIAKTEAKTYAELADKLPQNGPIQWSVPQQESVPQRMAQRVNDDASTAPLNATIPARVPTRTIASVADLPDEKPQRKLGSQENRSDVGSGRATMLVDTLEKAARKVSSTLTQDKIDQLAVNRDDVFKNDFKGKSKAPHYIVASFVAKPLQVADIGDLKDLGFANPFANAKNTNLAALNTSSKNGQTVSANGAAIGVDIGAGSSASPSRTGRGNNLSASAADGAAKNKSATLFEDPSGSDAPTGKAAANNSSGATGAQNSPSRTIASQGKPQARTPGSARNDFKSMDRSSIVKFLTASYRTVSGELENPDFISALATNHIQILDHENRRIGSTKPDAVFVYRMDLGRLVQTRASGK